MKKRDDSTILLTPKQLKQDIKLSRKDYRRPKPRKDTEPDYQGQQAKMESRKSYPRRVKGPKTTRIEGPQCSTNLCVVWAK